MRIERILFDQTRADGSALYERENRTSGKQLVQLMPEKLTAKKEPQEIQNINEKVEQLNKTADLFNKKLHFLVHDETEQIVVQVVNSETGEIIKQIPPEKILEVLSRIDQVIGIFVDELV